MKPPYEITGAMLIMIASISEKIGEINAAHLQKPPAELRKKARIRTIQSSLEIEGNSLSEEQITAILENKRVLAPQKDILEVKNAIAVYDQLSEFNPYSLVSFCNAHKLLMAGLVEMPGQLRTKGVGIVKGAEITHLAPPGGMVKALLNDLFVYLKKSKELLLIKSCVFHYELEFIHPFMDGNGRMGRLWQTVLLISKYPVFEFLPIESIVKQRQTRYYEALSKSDKSGHSTDFIEFMLEVINDALDVLLKSQNNSLTGSERIDLFKEKIKNTVFSRQDYLREFKEISTATASRDLKLAVDQGMIEKRGDKRMTQYYFVEGL